MCNLVAYCLLDHLSPVGNLRVGIIVLSTRLIPVGKTIKRQDTARIEFVYTSNSSILSNL